MSVTIRRWVSPKGVPKEEWQVFVVGTDPDGRTIRHRRVLRGATKREAIDEESRIRSAIRNGTYRLKRPEDAPTFAEFVPRYLAGWSKANQNRRSTYEGKERVIALYLMPRFGRRRLEDISDEDVQHLKGDMSDKAAKTVNNVLSTLSTMMKAAAEWNVIRHMPRIRMVKVPKAEVQFYEPEVYERMVAAAKKIGAEEHLIVLLGGDAGLRSGEIGGMHRTDISFTRGTLTVQRAEWRGEVGPTKSGRPRTIKMTRRLAAALRAHRHRCGPFVLCLPDGSPLSKKRRADAVRRVERRAGMQVTGRLHILRHTFCSRLAMLGASTISIRMLAGHESITTTQRYMHLSPASRDEAIGLLDAATVERRAPVGAGR